MRVVLRTVSECETRIVSAPQAADVAQAPDPASSGGSEGDIRQLLNGRGAAISALALGSIVGGVLEAGFLITVTRSAFAITDGDKRFGLVANIEVPVTLAIIVVVSVLLLGLGRWGRRSEPA